MSLFEGLLLLACAAFGGTLFGSLIGSTGAFRREAADEYVAIDAKVSGAA
jgi:hypothetical protein